MARLQVIKVAISPEWWWDRDDLVLKLNRGVYIEGVVLDPDGLPQHRAVVYCEMPGSWEGDGGQVRWLDQTMRAGGNGWNSDARTDEQGHFRLGPLPKGAEIEIWAQKGGYGDSDRMKLFAGAELDERLLLKPQVRCRVALHLEDEPSLESGKSRVVYSVEDGPFRTAGPALEGQVYEFSAPPRARVRVFGFAAIETSADSPLLFHGEIETDSLKRGFDAELWLGPIEARTDEPRYNFRDMARYANWGARYEIIFEDPTRGNVVKPSLISVNGGGVAIMGIAEDDHSLLLFVPMGNYDLAVQFKGYQPVGLQLSPETVGGKHRMKVPLRPLTATQ